MKRGALRFTACCVAAGMTFSGMSTVAFASKDVALVGFGAPVETEAPQMEAPETEAPVIADETPAETEPAAADEGSAEQETAYEPETAGTEAVETEAPQTEAVLDTSMSGEMAFAQCDEYVNIRSEASADSEAVGKVYNNGSVTILGQIGDWYEVQSGNAVGYVSADYFAVGEEAQAIADEVAYNVATVYAEALAVRAEPSEDSEQIGTVYSTDELEVVEYEGDWMKVALGGDVYGYISAYYVGYDTYYATGETLEEEQERLDQEWLDYLAQQEAEQAAAEQAYLDAIAAEQAAADQAAADAAYQAQAASQAAVDAQAAADAEYQNYLAAQAAADAATQQADEQAVIDAAAAAEAAYQQFLTAQSYADAQAQAEAEASYQAEADAAAAAQAAADAAAQAYAEATYTDDGYTEESYTDDSYSSSDLGQQIVNFATQFVGNPYVWGGTSLTNGADCSGFTQSVFANFGIGIPRTAAAQSGSGTPVDLGSIQAGDLLFYEGGSGIGHVTIYMGNGQVVHASNSNTGITISDYGYRTPVSARRYW